MQRRHPSLAGSMQSIGRMSWIHGLPATKFLASGWRRETRNQRQAGVFEMDVVPAVSSPAYPNETPGAAKGRWAMLNLTWVAFFLTFVVWYNLGAFKSTIARVLHLTVQQSDVLLLCNLALTIPARVGVGMLVDR